MELCSPYLQLVGVPSRIGTLELPVWINEKSPGKSRGLMDTPGLGRVADISRSEKPAHHLKMHKEQSEICMYDSDVNNVANHTI